MKSSLQHTPRFSFKGGDDDYVYFVIEGNFTINKPDGRNPVPVAHPIHVYGHEFVLLD